MLKPCGRMSFRVVFLGMEMAFDDAGKLAATKSILMYGGPLSPYRAYLKAVIEWQLAHSEDVKAPRAWRGIPQAPDLRERNDKFIANGLDDLEKQVPEHRPALVHGDLSKSQGRPLHHFLTKTMVPAPHNLLFGRVTKDLVAVIYFDFAHVGSPLAEFLYPFPQSQGILGGVAKPASGLRELTFNGFQGTI